MQKPPRKPGRRIHWGRLTMLALVLVAVGFWYWLIYRLIAVILG